MPSLGLTRFEVRKFYTGVQDTLTKSKGSTEQEESHVAKNNDISASDWWFYHILHHVWHSTLLVTSLKGDPFVSEGTLFGDRWSFLRLRGTVIYARFQPIQQHYVINLQLYIWSHCVVNLRGIPAETSSFTKCSLEKPLIDPRPCGNRCQRWIGSHYKL